MANVLIEIPFTGDFIDIDKFYEILGVNVENGYLEFGDADICFGSIDSEDQNIRFAISVNKELSEVESLIKENKGKIIEKGFDVSGPYLIAQDPAGINVRIEEVLMCNKR